MEQLDDLTWLTSDTPPFRLAGFPWFERDRRYRRLPVDNPEPLPKAVDNLANSTAGAQIAFRTNSRLVAIEATLAAPSNMYHMPATGQCGFDLYAGEPGRMRYQGTTKFERDASSYRVLLFETDASAMKSCIVHFPLYQGVVEVRVGLSPGAELAPPPPWALGERIVAYGTSITQGGCASRPGLAYTNILARALNVEVVNLGFSGAGKGEPEVIRAISTVPGPALFIFDYEGNVGGCDGVVATLPTAVGIIRERHPRVPLLIISRIPFARDQAKGESATDRLRSRDYQREFVESAQDGGDRRIHFLDGGTLFGEEFDECTVDGVHPNDLGFMRMARAIEPVVRKILGLRA